MTWSAWTQQLPRIGNPFPGWSSRQAGARGATGQGGSSSTNNRNDSSNQGYRTTALRRTHITAGLHGSQSSEDSSSCGCHSVVGPDVSTADGDDDIEADYLEIDSDIDNIQADLTYDPLRYREAPPTALERAHTMAASATTNLTATANSLATTASSFVASAATTAVKTAATTAAAGHAALKGVPAIAAERMRSNYDELRLRGPRRRLGLLNTPSRQGMEVMAVPVVQERAMSAASSAVLRMDLSELAAGRVRVERGLRESPESMQSNIQRSGWEDGVRSRGMTGTGSSEEMVPARLPIRNQTARPEELSTFIDQAKDDEEEDEDVEEEWHDVLQSGDDSDDESFDSCIEVLELEEKGEHAMEQAQRQFQRQQKERSKRGDQPLRREIMPAEENESFADIEVIQLPETACSSPPHLSRRSREAVIQRSQPRRPPSPGSSKIAMISYNVDKLPHSERRESGKFFEWD
ncbi:uncharacterized protein BKA78DRAFT_131457 [Phyllosticta capitalensis]|uniref:uncharacterized protein n=1 Tax=Phyllosticta capitalensis TaxID=121624 RepID=UPI00312F7922